MEIKEFKTWDEQVAKLIEHGCKDIKWVCDWYLYKLFIDKSIQRGYAENSGTDLDSIIPPTSRRQGARERKKQEVLRKIQLLVETYSGI